MSFWQSHGIIVESQPGVYKLIEEDLPKSQLEKLPINEIIIAEDEDNESAMASASDQREEELQVVYNGVFFYLNTTIVLVGYFKFLLVLKYNLLIII